MSKQRPSIPTIPEDEAMAQDTSGGSRRSSILSDKAWPDLKPLLKAKVGVEELRAFRLPNNNNPKTLS